MLARDIVKAKPDTIIVASPHNLRLLGKICVGISENSTGSLHTSPQRSVTLKAGCDVKFARELLQASVDSGLPAVGANYGTSSGPSSDLPMDWGTLVPLWFVLKGKGFNARVVIVTPSREIPLEQNVAFGKVIAKLSEKKKRKRFVFVASADQAHAHKKSGLYGFSKAAARYDKLVLDAIETNNLDSLARLDQRLVDHAKPDSLWQIAILAGICRTIRMKSMLYSYQVPTYYGMVCAGYHRNQYRLHQASRTDPR